MRTIRFYDSKGLLKPVSHSEAGYRYYNQESVEILQRILMLKYLGFSLQKIEQILHEQNMELELSEQKQLPLPEKAVLMNGCRDRINICIGKTCIRKRKRLQYRQAI